MKPGSSFTPVMVSRKVTSAAVSSPLLVVPPSSERVTVTTVVPYSLSAGVKLRTPVEVSIAGSTLNRVVSSAATVKVRTCPASPPVVMLDAQPEV